MDSAAPQKLSVLEKVGYSLGDLAANLIFQTLMTFLAYFYTDVYKIPAGQASAIIFFVGVFGAFFNPVMGAIADRTKTRWGKFRPWILWTSIPFGVIAILAFSAPDLSANAKLIYASTTYFLLVVIYSANNLPYAALSGVMTGSMSERNSLSSYRFFAVMVAQFIIQVFLLPLALILGGGDQAEGFQKVMTFFGLTGSVLLMITFFTTRERIIPTQDQHGSIVDDLKDLVANKPWILLLIATVLVFISLSLKNGLFIYYFKYYLNSASLAEFLDSSGFNGSIDAINSVLVGMGLTRFQWPEDPATSAFSLFGGIGIITNVLGIMFSRRLADKFGKRNVYIIHLALSSVFLFGFYFLPPDSTTSVFVLHALHGFFYGITIPILWAMVADVADFSEWKNNRRATAVIFSAMVFGLKQGLSIGGAAVAFLLSVFHYNAELDTQAPITVLGIRLSASLFVSVPFLIAAVVLFFYAINKEQEELIERDLLQRRLANAQ